MSGRATKWILFVVIPLLLALYASNPPVGVAIRKERVTYKTALTEQEAEDYSVRVGQAYVVARQTLWSRWLPLASGKQDVESQEIERRDDGVFVQDQTTYVRSRVKLGLDLAGGTELLYQLRPREGESVGATQTATTIAILKRRIDPQNVKEYRIQALERARILIQVPQATPAEVEQLKRRLEKMGKLEFRIAVPRGVPNARFQQMYDDALAGKVPEGFTIMHLDGDDLREFYLVRQGEAAITGRYLSRVYPTFDDMGQPAVGFEFDAVGSNRFGRITEENLHWSLAIVLDGVLRSAPVIQERIPGRGIIHGDFSQAEVADIVNILQAGSLPMDIELLQENTVGPQLGRDSIRAGMLALAVSGLLVVGFMGAYYMACGLVADGALLMNLVLLIGALCVLGAALTLPGMAGVMLTIGMAVDANVLIFERMREEAAAGKTVRLVLRNGYERAFTVIFDSNVTTVLSALVLYLVGTGPVRGFAVTLMIGLALSMFTALTVTRLAFETFTEKGWMKEFRMNSLFGRPSIPFCSLRKAAYVCSALLLVTGLVVFFVRGSSLYDIDFTGGSLVSVSLAQPTPVAEVRNRLAAAGFGNAEVQALRTDRAAGGAFTDFSIRLKGAGQERLQEEFVPQLRRELEAAGIMQPGDTVAVTPDNRAIRLNLTRQIGEMDLRRALGGNDPWSLERISTISSGDADALTQRVMIRLLSVPALAEERDVQADAVTALSWVGLKTQDYSVQACVLDENAPAVRLVLDKPLGQALLNVELQRRGFPELQATAQGSAGTEFTVGGPKEALERFAKEFPEGADVRGVPVVDVEGYMLTASLSKPYTEPDIRLAFEKLGMSDLAIVPEDVTSRSWRLNLSAEPLRERISAAFADLAPKAGEVSFTDTGQVEEGRKVVKLSFGRPMPFSAASHYIESAGLGPYGEGLIVDAGSYTPGTAISELRLRVPSAKADAIERAVTQSFAEPQPVQRITSIGATVAAELQGRAFLAVAFASVITIIYLGARFHAARWGVAAVIALVHDVLISMGLIAICDTLHIFGDVKVSMGTLAALLTIMGYSVNDTIVVFDRIRENMALLGRKRVSAELIDESVNQTLSRTVLTSLTVLMVVVALFALGGPVLHGLSLTLIFGIIVGTYSSVFIASAVVLDWEELMTGVRVALRVVFLPITLPLKGLQAAFGHSDR